MNGLQHANSQSAAATWNAQEPHHSVLLTVRCAVIVHRRPRSRARRAAIRAQRLPPQPPPSSRVNISGPSGQCGLQPAESQLEVAESSVATPTASWILAVQATSLTQPSTAVSLAQYPVQLSPPQPLAKLPPLAIPPLLARLPLMGTILHPQRSCQQAPKPTPQVLMMALVQVRAQVSR